jgi:hypothetical protein
MSSLESGQVVVEYVAMSKIQLVLNTLILHHSRELFLARLARKKNRQVQSTRFKPNSRYATNGHRMLEYLVTIRFRVLRPALLR